MIIKTNVMKISFLKKTKTESFWLLSCVFIMNECMCLSPHDGFTRLSFQQVVQRLPVTISYNLLD